MSCSGVCWHINTKLFVQGGGVAGRDVVRGLASNLQGLASNTIWRETIQFAGVKGEGGIDNEQEQKDQQVRGSQRIRSASRETKQKETERRRI